MLSGGSFDRTKPREGFESPYISEQLFFDLGIISEITISVSESKDIDSQMAKLLKDILVLFTIPAAFWPENVVESDDEVIKAVESALTSYAENIGINLVINTPLDDKVLLHFAKRAITLRARSGVGFVDYPDMVFAQSILSSNGEVDGDSQAMVALYQGKLMVRWTLPSSDVYQRVTNIDALIYTALVMMEELCHISQMHLDGSMTIHTLQYTINPKRLTDTDELTEHFDSVAKIFMGLVSSLAEADVTKLMITAFPNVVNTQWYQDRVAKKFDDSDKEVRSKHYPMAYNEMWQIAFTIEKYIDEIKKTNNWALFMTESLMHLPELVRTDMDSVQELFTDIMTLRILLPLVIGIATLDEYSMKDKRNFAVNSIVNPIIYSFVRHYIQFGRLPGKDDDDLQVCKEILSLVIAYLENNLDVYIRIINELNLPKTEHRISPPKDQIEFIIFLAQTES